MAQKCEKQDQNLESAWKADPNKLYKSKLSRAPGFYFITPRNVVDKNIVLNNLPRLYKRRLSSNISSTIFTDNAILRKMAELPTPMQQNLLSSKSQKNESEV